jgi:cell division septation protein DedD
MPTKLRAKRRVRAAIISGVLCAVTVLWVGCDGNRSPAKVAPPAPHRLGDIALRGSEAPTLLTPTAVVSPGPPPAHTPAAMEDTPEVGEAGAPLPIEKNQSHAAEDSPDTTAGLPGDGDFTIQIGAYIIDKNLNHIRDKVASLGFSPYVKEMTQTIRMYCVIVGEGLSKDEASEVASALTVRGFDARRLPGKDGTVDVTAGI